MFQTERTRVEGIVAPTSGFTEDGLDSNGRRKGLATRFLEDGWHVSKTLKLLRSTLIEGDEQG
jgi:hypothetical protein